LVYELASKIGEAIPYCAKAISLCKSRLQNLKNAKESLLADGGDSASADGGSKKSSVEDEMEVITGILPDLEKKVNKLDLIHVINSIMIFNLLMCECKIFFLDYNEQ
jgi:nuclear autoantigenic sperm protein